MPNDFVKRANVHQTHIEDLVLLGRRGIDELNHKIENFLKILNKESGDALNTTVKIDGSPAVICWSKFPGYPDNSICLKSFVDGPEKAHPLSSAEEIDSKYGDRPVMCPMLKYALKIAPSIPKGEAWQGDCLFTSNSKKEKEIQGTTYLTFQPNKIIYAFTEENPGYEKVRDADFGICFHTIYRPNGKGGMTQEFDSVDPSVLNLPNNIYAMSPAIDKTEGANFDIQGVMSKYEELKEAEERLLSDPDYEDLISNDLFMKYWSTFENANISDKQLVTLDLKTLYNDLMSYIKDKRTAEYDKYVKTHSKPNALSRAKSKYEMDMVEIQDILESNKEVLVDLVDTLNKASELKMILLDGFKKNQKNYSNFFNSRSKGFLSTGDEGITMSDSDGNVVKLIDRPVFSYANRSDDIIGGWESNESLDEDKQSFIEAYGKNPKFCEDYENQFNRLWESEGHTCVMAFGRMNPPTIGHKKLIEKLKSEAEARGGEARLYLSHKQGKSKNKQEPWKDADPLDYDSKLRYCQEAFGNIVKPCESRTLSGVLTEVYNDGFDTLVFVGGADRIGGEEDITGFIKKYNGVKDTRGNYYNFVEPIEFINAGKRNKNSKDPAEQASGTLLRELAYKGNFEGFEKFSAVKGNSARDMYNDVRRGLGAPEEVAESVELSENVGDKFEAEVASMVNSALAQAKKEGKISGTYTAEKMGGAGHEADVKVTRSLLGSTDPDSDGLGSKILYIECKDTKGGTAQAGEIRCTIDDATGTLTYKIAKPDNKGESGDVYDLHLKAWESANNVVRKFNDIVNDRKIDDLINIVSKPGEEELKILKDDRFVYNIPIDSDGGKMLTKSNPISDLMKESVKSHYRYLRAEYVAMRSRSGGVLFCKLEDLFDAIELATIRLRQKFEFTYNVNPRYSCDLISKFLVSRFGVKEEDISVKSAGAGKPSVLTFWSNKDLDNISFDTKEESCRKSGATRMDKGGHLRCKINKDEGFAVFDITQDGEKGKDKALVRGDNKRQDGEGVYTRYAVRTLTDDMLVTISFFVELKRPDDNYDKKLLFDIDGLIEKIRESEEAEKREKTQTESLDNLRKFVELYSI